MQFRDLARQYEKLKPQMDEAILKVCADATFISGPQVEELEMQLAEYVGVKHCIACANGTDALSLALMAWDIGPGDAVFVPDLTFFASGEVVSFEGATPIFVDCVEGTFNMDAASLETAVGQVLQEGRLKPRAVIPVDLLGLPADHPAIRQVADKYGLLVLEDAAQGFGGTINGKRAASFGDISTTSFFPAKPLGCYGDGGAIFTDNDAWNEHMRSLRVHGKGSHKYDNVRIGVNSRLDTMQAAVLQVKMRVFDEELVLSQQQADYYTSRFAGLVPTPEVPAGYTSAWAQYTLRLPSHEAREALAQRLQAEGIPSMVYYPIPMHRQRAFAGTRSAVAHTPVATRLCDTVLSLPMHPYLTGAEREKVADVVVAFLQAQ